MNRRRLGVMALVLLLSNGLWWGSRYLSAEARIRRTLSGLLREFSFTQSTGLLAKAAKTQAVLGRITADFSLDVEQVLSAAPPLSGREEVQTAIMAAFRQLGSCTITVHDVAVTSIDDDVGSARASFTLSVLTTQPTMELPGQEFEVELKRSNESQWQVRRIAAVRTLRR